MWPWRSEWVEHKLAKVLAHLSVTKLAFRAVKELLKLINKKNENQLFKIWDNTWTDTSRTNQGKKKYKLPRAHENYSKFSVIREIKIKATIRLHYIFIRATAI